MASDTPLHIIDIIRKKRDGGDLDVREIGFVAAGAADGSIPEAELAAWLMASWIRGLSLGETRALTMAMRDSGVRFSPTGLGRMTVDKHSSGGVGDKTSFLVAPLAAACGVAVPMISGRALGHTGGTLDKLEAIPGYRTALTLAEFEAVIKKCGASIIGQTDQLAPADRKLYALRDRTGTVENPGTDLRVDIEQEAGGGAGRAGSRRENGFGRVPAQDGGHGISCGADGGDGRGRGDADGCAADGHESAAGARGRELD